MSKETEVRMLAPATFETMCARLRHLPEFEHAAIVVHDDLDVARSIAISIYGPQHWRRHVIEVHGLLAQETRVHKAMRSLVTK